MQFRCARDLQAKQGTVTARTKKLFKTKIMEGHVYEMKQKVQPLGVQGVLHVPKLYLVHIKCLDERLMAIEESQGEREDYPDNQKYVWTIVNRKETWARVFLPSQH